MTLLQVEDLWRTFGTGAREVHALRGLSLEVKPGEFTAISGPSGSGKTTLLNLIGALDRASRGRVLLEGQDVGMLDARARSHLRRDRIGFIFQAYNLIAVQTALENATAVLALQGVPHKEREARGLALLDELGLADKAHRFPDALSGGQQQRVAVARAILAEPALVLADEPTANLDSETAERLLGLMGRLNQERGVTFVFSTHDPRVMEHARRNVVLVDGVVSEDR